MVVMVVIVIIMVIMAMIAMAIYGDDNDNVDDGGSLAEHVSQCGHGTATRSLVMTAQRGLRSRKSSWNEFSASSAVFLRPLRGRIICIAIFTAKTRRPRSCAHLAWWTRPVLSTLLRSILHHVDWLFASSSTPLATAELHSQSGRPRRPYLRETYVLPGLFVLHVADALELLDRNQ